MAWGSYSEGASRTGDAFLSPTDVAATSAAGNSDSKYYGSGLRFEDNVHYGPSYVFGETHQVVKNNLFLAEGAGACGGQGACPGTRMLQFAGERHAALRGQSARGQPHRRLDRARLRRARRALARRRRAAAANVVGDESHTGPLSLSLSRPDPQARQRRDGKLYRLVHRRRLQLAAAQRVPQHARRRRVWRLEVRERDAFFRLAESTGFPSLSLPLRLRTCSPPFRRGAGAASRTSSRSRTRTATSRSTRASTRRARSSRTRARPRRSGSSRARPSSAASRGSRTSTLAARRAARSTRRRSRRGSASRSPRSATAASSSAASAR